MSAITKKRLSSEVYEDQEAFDNSFPRSGKWSIEEERFAKKLIEDFQSGILKDCEEGCTLRAYLARKLNCAPMRISKKFAGKCIGKNVFSKKDGTDSFRNLANLVVDPLILDQNSESRSFMSSRSESSLESNFYNIHNSNFNNLFDGQTSNDESTVEKSISISIESHSLNSYPTDPTEIEEIESEAEEWKDVLAYFCGGLSNFAEMNNSPNLKSSLSQNTLFF